MKKSSVIARLILIVLGFVLIYIASEHSNNNYTGLLFAVGGIFVADGLISIFKLYYWNNNKEKYDKKIEEVKIEQNDELKQKLRDKSGRYSYIVGIYTLIVSIVVFGLLGMFNILNVKVILIFLGTYLLLQISIGILIFNYLLKQYEWWLRGQGFPCSLYLSLFAFKLKFRIKFINNLMINN